MPEEGKREHNIFLHILLGGVFLAIVSSFYFFYYKKDYDFIVETKCNPESETCFYRDCTNPDDCPPNNLSYYNEYTIKAKDFMTCENEDCSIACITGIIECVKTECADTDIEKGICVVTSNQEIQN